MKAKLSYLEVSNGANDLTRSSIALHCTKNGSSLSKGSADGPSHLASSGFG